MYHTTMYHTICYHAPIDPCTYRLHLPYPQTFEKPTIPQHATPHPTTQCTSLNLPTYSATRATSAHPPPTPSQPSCASIYAPPSHSCLSRSAPTRLPAASSKLRGTCPPPHPRPEVAAFRLGPIGRTAWTPPPEGHIWTRVVG